MNKESQTVEYKQNWHNDNLKVVSAFANSGGGALFVGLSEKYGTLSLCYLLGIKDAREILTLLFLSRCER